MEKRASSLDTEGVVKPKSRWRVGNFLLGAVGGALVGGYFGFAVARRPETLAAGVPGTVRFQGWYAQASWVLTGERRHTTTAYVTVVSIDPAGRTVPAPPLLLETEEDERLALEASARRDHRLRSRATVKPAEPRRRGKRST